MHMSRDTMLRSAWRTSDRCAFMSTSQTCTPDRSPPPSFTVASAGRRTTRLPRQRFLTFTFAERLMHPPAPAARPRDRPGPGARRYYLHIKYLYVKLIIRDGYSVGARSG